MYSYGYHAWYPLPYKYQGHRRYSYGNYYDPTQVVQFTKVLRGVLVADTRALPGVC